MAIQGRFLIESGETYSMQKIEMLKKSVGLKRFRLFDGRKNLFVFQAASFRVTTWDKKNGKLL